MLLGKKIQTLYQKLIFIGVLAVCLPMAVQAQEPRDRIEIIDSIQILEDMQVQDTITPRDTIITISDTIIRISDNVISQQGRGEDRGRYHYRKRQRQKKWDKMTHAFKKDSTKNVNIIGFPIIAYCLKPASRLAACSRFIFVRRSRQKIVSRPQIQGAVHPEQAVRSLCGV